MPPGIMTNAGALVDGKVTDKTFKMFCEDVKKELQEGTESLNLPLPCLPEIAPDSDGALFDKLCDPKVFPEFHAIWRPRYEETLKSLDVQGGMPLFPIFDPTALAILLDVDFTLDLPGILLAIAMGPGLIPWLELESPDIKLKLPDFTPPVPDIPIPAIPIPIPSLDTKLELELALYLMPIKLFQLLLPKFPELITMPPTLPKIIEWICETAGDAAKLPPLETQNTQFVASRTLLRHTAMKAMPIVVFGSAMGNGLGVKAMGKDAGYDPTPDPPPEPKKTGGGRGVLYKFDLPGKPHRTIEESMGGRAYRSPSTGMASRFLAPRIALEETSDAFRDRLIEAANTIGIPDPNWLAAVITNESAGAYHPHVVRGLTQSGLEAGTFVETNPKDPGISGALAGGGESVGIIQFENFILGLLRNPPQSMQARGVQPSDISRENLLSSTETSQFKYIEEFFNFVLNQASPKLQLQTVGAVAAAVNTPKPQNIIYANAGRLVDNPTGRAAVRAAEGLFRNAKSRGFIE